MADAEEIQHYSVFATWSGDGKGCGTMKLPQGDLSIPIGGSKALEGCGLGTNPEELLLAAVAACFVNTWAIFLKKLGVSYAEPSVAVTGELGKDPDGGYKMLSSAISAVVQLSEA